MEGRMVQQLKRSASLVFICALVLGILLPTMRVSALTATIWPTSATPATLTDSDKTSVELGVKFRTSTAGTITGIRFYKGPQNTGTHTGSLWTRTGTKLATVTFTNETASGWQQANFATPVNVNANTTYVASYHAPVGRYSSTSNYFANNATTNGPLTALKNGTDGGNGVYRYGSNVAFPNSSYQSTNYWVDVVFSYAGASDTIPPTVTSVVPSNNATAVAANSNVTAQFSEPVNASTVPSALELRTNTNAIVPANITYNAATATATLDPLVDLTAGQQYTATVKTSLQDIAGNALASNYIWSFQVAGSSGGGDPGLVQGPGGPILVVTATDKPFSGYYAEILRAEGLTAFASADVSTLTAPMLNQYDVVLVGDIVLTTSQVTLLTDWVTAGGNLIAMHPDKKLAGLLGLTDQATVLNDAYMLVNTNSAPGSGITSQTMQYHGSADRYLANGGTATVATLYSNESTATSSPAVTIRSVGSQGGQAAAFSYDLARSVVYTRQGNPAWAGQERDGSSPIRPNDLFFGAKAGDVQPDYVNLDKVAIPQADEQQRLLANMIGDMNQDRKPLPKLWYLPNGKKAAVIMAGDDHGTANGTKNTFDYLVANSPAGCIVANLECFRATSWAYTGSGLTNSEAASYQSQGFDIGSHVSTDCNDWTPASLAAAFTHDLADFQSKYTSLPAQHGSRTHCIAWSDWATQPKVELDHDIRMDLNYYYWPGTWVQNRPGFFTGSGIPMRFADLDGTMIDVYQAPSHLVNESGMTFPAAIDTQLDRALGSEGYYGAFGTHYDHSDNFDQQLVQSAKARNVPLISVQQMLDWSDGRNASYFSQLAWSGNNLTFTANTDTKVGTMLRGMLPLNSSKGTLQGITRNGASVNFTSETIKGVAYAIFPVTNGNFTAIYNADIVAPTITSTLPSVGSNGANPAANITATFSEAMNVSSINSSTFELRAGSTIVPANVSYDPVATKATLDPTSTLAVNTTYTATIRGGGTDPRAKDLSGNALANDYVWTFTTSTAQPQSLWPTVTPTLTGVATNDTSSVELGVAFRSDVAGTIGAIRFYKGANEAAQHTVTLWDGSGTSLGTATTTSETATGWQTATFATPIPIAANTTYTASYFAPNGQYPYTLNYFAQPYTNGGLHVAVSGGVYRYSGGFPTSSFEASNYWVDVVFTP